MFLIPAKHFEIGAHASITVPSADVGVVDLLVKRPELIGASGYVKSQANFGRFVHFCVWWIFTILQCNCKSAIG